MDKATPGEDPEQKICSTCSYYKLIVAGETVIEIDLLNFVEIVGGEDRLAKQRAALGI